MLKWLCDVALDSSSVIMDYLNVKEEMSRLESGKSNDRSLWRVEPLGVDYCGNRYWCFDDRDGPEHVSQPIYFESAVDGRWGRIARHNDLVRLAQSLSLRRSRGEAQLRKALYDRFCFPASPEKVGKNI